MSNPPTDNIDNPAVAAPQPAPEEPKPTATVESAPVAAVDEPKEPAPTTLEEDTAKDVKPAGGPLSQLLDELPVIINEAGYREVWGVELSDGSNVPTTIVLEKFLRANTNDVAKAKAQLVEALIWRKKMNPLHLLANTEHDSSKFGGLGYVTTYKSADGKGKEIVTWNIYGAVKDNKETFGDIEEFVKWRTALMELSLRELDLASATVPIPADGIDQYQMVQVHDYLNVSFLRMDPTIRAASKETIQTFSMAYPELLKEKFFVNVPLVMGWVFAAMKLFLSPATIKKFHPLSYGASLAGELPGWGDQLPPAYGGKGEGLEKGLKVQYAGTGGETATK